MTEFDYIEHGGLRAALESDYIEMQRCVEAEAWKSAQVLAGSIVESLLMDFLVSRPSDGGKPATLRLDFSDAIKECLKEKAITERTADLCAVVRSYRNLIHPARLVRLGEASPTKASCGIAVGLIDLITSEVGDSRRLAVGLTAEQVLAKVVADTKSGSLMKHLLSGVRESHLMRLAKVLLPEALAEHEAEFDDIGRVGRLTATFRAVLAALPPARQTEVADEFALLVRQGSEQEIDRYRRGFFRAPDLQTVSPQYRDMVKDHLLSALGVGVQIADIRAATGIGRFLSTGDAAVWVNNLVRATVSKSGVMPVRKWMHEFVVAEHGFVSPEFEQAAFDRMDKSIERLERNGDAVNAELIRSTKLEIEIPF
ncbi:hypothetical protein [Luteibacter yeojuensis]|uniref:Uncharacterized protein n=1 Tax=Luteibacter yeojuensis TaxID=345309 RepID=A0A7X5QRL3_9GAMM|nr:hypothetical protein [Luteibacter yeojuensis]NID14110.1 hypothetical protein [Luteibacter yeojuensis]